MADKFFIYIIKVMGNNPMVGASVASRSQSPQVIKQWGELSPGKINACRPFFG